MNPNEQTPAGSETSSQESAVTTPVNVESGPSYLTVTKTISSWAFTLDHVFHPLICFSINSRNIKPGLMMLEQPRLMATLTSASITQSL